MLAHRRMQARRPSRIAAFFMVLLIAGMAMLVIGVSAYLLDHAGIDTQREWWWMLPSALLAILIVVRGSVWFERRQPRADRTALDDWQRDFNRQLDRRQGELERDPDPQRRKYATLVAQGNLIPDAEIVRRNARLAEIAGDAVKMKYADRIFRGETITDLAIAYWEDPAMLVTCEHLRAIEADLRTVDPHMRPQSQRKVFTARDLDGEALAARYGLPQSIVYEAGYYNDRGPSENPRLTCAAHGSWIEGDFGPLFPPG